MNVESQVTSEIKRQETIVLLCVMLTKLESYKYLFTSSSDSLIIYQIKLLLFIIFKHIEFRNLTLKQIDITQASLLFPKNIFFPFIILRTKCDIKLFLVNVLI